MRRESLLALVKNGLVNPAGLWRGGVVRRPERESPASLTEAKEVTRKTNDRDRGERRRQSDDEDDAPYEVGYRKPPVAHRFCKGQSGNPAGSKSKRGKARRGKTLRAELIDELSERIAVTEGGRRRHVPRQTALVKKLIADALGGDAKARAQLIQLANKAEVNTETEDADDLIGAAKDAEVLDLFRADIIRQYKESNDE